MRLVWLLLAWTMVEIGLFAAIGGQIGVLATWAVVLGSAAVGIDGLMIEFTSCG